MDACKSAFGRVDVLVCNAGIMIMSDLESTTLNVWNKTMNINALATFLGIRTVAPLVKVQGGGSIVCTASTGAVRGGALLAAYCASKGAVRMLCKSLALELIPFNIRVNIINPGTCDTPMVGRTATELGKRPSDMGIVAPIGRLAQPREIAEAVVYLASDRVSYMMGVDMTMDSGNSCGLTGSSPV
ncbi:putative mitochondrial dehydrogenase/oxidoreductase-like protein [Leptomonas pyrrhocoris]|uniref:Putative mitochondrial dehydrogenase/oxidoreductase-like protein n=1 Tax=Leptomonas pyrrhocoris TaxID=157538 RepID=A0A0M9FXF3_LEPPY|nr:putative mitochondrial dehydrogenase/oxidoreductase-like protein [Leptomonas pyrrhocoris]XP_015656530.1 putative mitochondrial dehydrogenase/oxidoreductase-like protein [Leptomonas pyrrhocoris]KPA78090.1 putative mitochondrial dehydrogenase/oxidoreductase-like protein [Leptomonas pyrrhocoris]KPA78091.1 putative mitochondrial dehydrogenase/oxidoreductase-like protein [Leptomonas pyrrhocoris]|eukprot:XP_015656529.1 putative mitochondrial dehydrogenase/oxidoreductase-like protein [Leptomonas pyrrhocoris]